MAQMGITCYRCEKRQEFQSYIELRSHLETVHQGLYCYNDTKGNERQNEEALLKEEFGRADLELKLERSERKVNTLMESLELKEQGTGQLQEDLWIMSEKKAKLEQKYKEVCNNMEELGKKHADESKEMRRKALLKIRNMQRVIEEVKIERGRILEENEELRMKLEDLKKDEQGFASKEEFEIIRKHAQECQDKLTEVERVVVNQRIEIEELSEAGEDFKQIIQDLEEEIIYMSKEGIRYKEENEELKKLATRKEEEIRKLQDEKESQENIVSNLEESNRCLSEKNSAVGKELSTASLEMKRVQYELDSEQKKGKQYEADTKELLAELGELKTEIRMKDFKVAEYEERMDFMTTGLGILQDKISNDNSENIMFQKKMKDIVEFCYCNLQERQREGAKWLLATNDKTMKWANEGSWIGKKEDLHATNKERERLRKRVQQLEEELDKARENIVNHGFIWRNKEHETMTSLRKEFENQVKNSKRLQRENKQLEKSIRELEAKLMQSYGINEKLQYDLEESNVEFEEIQRKYDEISSENYQLIKTISELRDTNERLVDEVNMLKNMKDKEKEEQLSRKKKIFRKKSSEEERIAREHYKRKNSSKTGNEGDQEELGTMGKGVQEEYRIRDETQKKKAAADDADYLTEDEEKCARNTAYLIEQADVGDNEAKGALEDFETSVNVDEKENTSESLESMEFKYLEAKIEFENKKEKMFGRRQGEEVEFEAKQQSTSAPQAHIKQHSTDKFRADLKQQSTNGPRLDKVKSDMMKERTTTARKPSAVTPCLTTTLSCSKNLPSPLPSDLSVAFLTKRSSRFENADPEIEDEAKKKSKKIFSKKELEMIAEDAVNNECKDTESGVHFCNDDDVVKTDDDDRNVTASGVWQYSYKKDPSLKSLRYKEFSATEIEQMNSFASESGDSFVDYTLGRGSSTGVGKKVGGRVYHVANQDSSLALSQSTNSLTWGYIQALEDVSTPDILVKKGEGSMDQIKRASDVLQTDYFEENQYEALGGSGMLVQKGEGSTGRTRRSSDARQPDFSWHKNISNDGTNAARRKKYNREVDSEMHGEQKLRFESRSEKIEAEEAVKCCDKKIGSVDSVEEVHISESDPTVVNVSENGDQKPRNQGVDSVGLEECDSQHSANSLPQQGQKEPESLQQMKNYQGRRHSLAYELLKRKKLDFDFKQEYRAKESSDRANNRRISSGEVDVEKLREKARAAKQNASKLTNEDDTLYTSGQAVARIGWFQMTALADRSRKRNDASHKQDKYSDVEEKTDDEADEEHTDKTVHTDDSDLSVYSDSDDSDSSDSHDSESLPDDLDVNAYIQELLNTDTSEKDRKVSSPDERASNKDVIEDGRSNASTQNDDTETETAIKQQDKKYETTEERRGRLEKTKAIHSDEEEQGLPPISEEINSS